MNLKIPISCNKFTLARKKMGIKRVGNPAKTGGKTIHVNPDFPGFVNFELSPEIKRQLKRTK